MMLVQKQPTLLLSQPISTHRRHPSAPPVVIVQPTRTPGLLSLSKPPHKSSPTRQPPSNQRTVQMKGSPKPRAAQPARPALLNAAEITDKRNANHPAARPSKTAPKQQATNDSKASPPRSHGKHARQPSPPALPIEPSQAEAFNSDPFLDSFSSHDLKPSSPALIARPSGKLAHRRLSQQNFNPMSGPTIPTPTKAIPVPVAPRRTTQQLSRSEPALSHSWDHICDDSNDEGGPSPPVTPIRTRAQAFFNNGGPRTAPISARTPGSFSFQETSSSTKRRIRNHKRTPSDGVFAMSSDDEASSGAEDLRALLNFVRTGSHPASMTTPPPQRGPNPAYFRSLSPASREKYFELEAQKEVAGYFASSSFQNSPSPDDLPDPSFA